MDGAEVAVNCLCSARSCATCWCPDHELADGHRHQYQYSKMAEVMEELDAARDALLDEDDTLVGRVKDVKDVEKRLRHRLLPRNAWRLVLFFELFMSAPKDELHQWYILVYTSMYKFIPVCTDFTFVGRYLGLFGDHIIPAVLYRYTQVLRRPDLVNSKGKPPVTTARIEALWKRLSDRFKTVVADTSMITMSTA